MRECYADMSLRDHECEIVNLTLTAQGCCQTSTIVCQPHRSTCVPNIYAHEITIQNAWPAGNAPSIFSGTLTRPYPQLASYILSARMHERSGQIRNKRTLSALLPIGHKPASQDKVQLANPTASQELPQHPNLHGSSSCQSLSRTAEAPHAPPAAARLAAAAAAARPRTLTGMFALCGLQSLHPFTVHLHLAQPQS